MMENLTAFEKITLACILKQKMRDSEWMIEKSSCNEKVKNIFRDDIVELKEIIRKLNLMPAE